MIADYYVGEDAIDGKVIITILSESRLDTLKEFNVPSINVEESIVTHEILKEFDYPESYLKLIRTVFEIPLDAPTFEQQAKLWAWLAKFYEWAKSSNSYVLVEIQ